MTPIPALQSAAAIAATANAAMRLLTEHPLWAIRPEAYDALATLSRTGGPVAHTLDPPASGVVTAPDALRGSRGHITRSGVAIVPLRGVITPHGSWIERLFGEGGGGLNGFRASMHEALADDEVTAIIIDVDSPGGSTALVPETAAAVRASRGIKPIVAAANTMACSAAYWIGSQADELVVTPSGIVGSVGTVMTHYDFSAWNEQMGLEVTYVTAGRYKAEGNENEPLSDEARAEWQAWVDELQELFVDGVAEGRGVTAAAVNESFGQGRVVRPAAALAARMVDRIEPIGETVARLSAGRGRRTPGARAELPGGAAELPAAETAVPPAEAPAVEALPPAEPSSVEEPPAAAAVEQDPEAASAAARMRLQRALSA